jgi:ribosomal protein S15P/S13E
MVEKLVVTRSWQHSHRALQKTKSQMSKLLDFSQHMVNQLGRLIDS